ncbi:head-tail connector protein [Roseovarius sp. D0-M9]|uniref:head-tail connector protein n=1 Tax=Roseovarius sp. D0-M9 TaxID=3127117 RepID=UPI00301000A1
MMLIEETAVPEAALPVDQFKAHLRLGTGFADDDVQDAVLQSFLRAAIASIEARTGKVLIERVFSWELIAWRTGYGQALPVAPVKAIEEVVLRHTSGSEVIADPAHYRLEKDTHLGRDEQQESVHYTVDYTTGIVTFLHPPNAGDAVTAGFEFDVPVRFDTDRIMVSVASFQAGDAPNVPVVEIRV